MARIGLFLTIATLLVACGGTAPERTSARSTASAKKLVYIKGASFIGPIYAANADGTGKKKLRRGAYPAISPNGKWVGYVSADREELRLIPPSGGEFLQTTIDDHDLFKVEFSPNSKFVAVSSPTRLYVNNIATGKTIKTGRGAIRGFSFSPDSKRVIYGKAKVGSTYGAPSTLYTLDIAGNFSAKLSAGMNPLWTSAGIFYDLLAEMSTGALPHFSLVKDNVPVVSDPPVPDDLTNGLRAVDASADGTRVLATFEGQSRNDPYAIENGTARALGAFTPSDLSRDGSAVLGSTGTGDPSDPSDVVTAPWGGGRPTVLVSGASWARWNR